MNIRQLKLNNYKKYVFITIVVLIFVFLYNYWWIFFYRPEAILQTDFGGVICKTSEKAYLNTTNVTRIGDKIHYGDAWENEVIENGNIDEIYFTILNIITHPRNSITYPIIGRIVDYQDFMDHYTYKLNLKTKDFKLIEIKKAHIKSNFINEYDSYKAPMYLEQEQCKKFFKSLDINIKDRLEFNQNNFDKNKNYLVIEVNNHKRFKFTFEDLQIPNPKDYYGKFSKFYIHWIFN